MIRTALARKSPMRRGKRKSKYARRPRDLEYMRFVRGLLCSVEEEYPDRNAIATLCFGPIEADHLGDRGLSHKADDMTCAPMCQKHHRERTDHTGTFKHIDRETARAWRARAIARTQTYWEER